METISCSPFPEAWTSTSSGMASIPVRAADPVLVSIFTFSLNWIRTFYAAGNTGTAFEVYNEVLDYNPYDTVTRKLLIERLMESGQSNTAYEQALILWNQGCKDKETVSYLYSVRPDVWRSVYTQMNP